MELRRCAILSVGLDDTPRFDLDSLLSGGDALDEQPRWLVHAPHLAEPVELEPGLIAVLGEVPRDEFTDRAVLAARHGDVAIATLAAAGLLLARDDDRAAAVRDAGLREVEWWPPAAVAHYAGAWRDVDVEARREAGLMPSARRLVEQNGPAPDPDWRLRPEDAPLPLAPARRTAFDDLLARRRTCRNYLADAAIPADALSTMLLRVWGAAGTRTLAPGAVVVRKGSPAGGGLHAIEAFVVVQRAEGLAPGIYHYLAMEHALEPVQALSPGAAADLVRRAVAGQPWFEPVPVIVVMVARFDRLFWKYRRHAKAWRVAHLDVGHLSQTMYLSAADLGLGAFVTAAINDAVLEEALGLAPGRQGVIALVGFGPPDPQGTQPELDPVEPTESARRARAD